MVQAGSSVARKWENDFYTPVGVNLQNYGRVKKTYKQVNPRKAVLVKIAVLLFAYAVLIVFLCIKSATLGYQIVTLQNDIAKTEVMNRKLEYSIAAQTSLKRVEWLASTQLGMCPADSQSRFTIEAPHPIQVASQHHSSSQQVKAGDNTLHIIYNNLRVLAQKTN